MNKNDKYELFLKLSNRNSLCSTPLQNIPSPQQPHHPGVLNGLRNKNLESYKAYCSPSKIFERADTSPSIQTERRPTKYEATERKQQIDKNSIRTINPSLEKCQSPEQSSVKQNIRYNVNSESSYKDPKRYKKHCKQKESDFDHRINLPISKMQVTDAEENPYGSNYKSHKKSLSIKFVNLQSEMQNDQFYSIYTDRGNKQKYEDFCKHLLTSYEKKQTDKQNGKKVYPQSKSIYQQTMIEVSQQKIKPYHKIFQESTENKENSKKEQKKGLGNSNLNQQKSTFMIY